MLVSSENVEASLPLVPDDTEINSQAANNTYANTDKESKINRGQVQWKIDMQMHTWMQTRQQYVQ